MNAEESAGLIVCAGSNAAKNEELTMTEILCPYCNLEFGTTIKNGRTKDGETTLPCPRCGKVLALVNYYRQHHPETISVQLNVPASCDKCRFFIQHEQHPADRDGGPIYEYFCGFGADRDTGRVHKMKAIDKGFDATKKRNRFCPIVPPDKRAVHTPPSGRVSAFGDMEKPEWMKQARIIHCESLQDAINVISGLAKAGRPGIVHRDEHIMPFPLSLEDFVRHIRPEMFTKFLDHLFGYEPQKGGKTGWEDCNCPDCMEQIDVCSCNNPKCPHGFKFGQTNDKYACDECNIWGQCRDYRDRKIEVERRKEGKKKRR